MNYYMSDTYLINDKLGAFGCALSIRVHRFPPGVREDDW